MSSWPVSVTAAAELMASVPPEAWVPSPNSTKRPAPLTEPLVVVRVNVPPFCPDKRTAPLASVSSTWMSVTTLMVTFPACLLELEPLSCPLPTIEKRPAWMVSEPIEPSASGKSSSVLCSTTARVPKSSVISGSAAFGLAITQGSPMQNWSGWLSAAASPASASAAATSSAERRGPVVPPVTTSTPRHNEDLI
jgi:hypothetical protein